MKAKLATLGFMVLFTGIDYNEAVNDCGSCCPDNYILFDWANQYGYYEVSRIMPIWLVAVSLLVLWILLDFILKKDSL